MTSSELDKVTEGFERVLRERETSFTRRVHALEQKVDTLKASNDELRRTVETLKDRSVPWCGTYQHGARYRFHDLVQRNSQMWISLRDDNADVPGHAPESWRLAAKTDFEARRPVTSR